MNGLKTIFSRMTTMKSSVDALANIGVSVKDMEGNMKPVARIIDDLAGKWSSLNSEQQQSIGLQIAGRFQLSRFLVLMQSHEQALKATETAMNSTGSGMRENQEYLKSLEARLNKLSNAWTEFAINAGDAILSDGIIAFAEGLSSVTKNASGVVKFIGFLPPVLGATTLAIIAMNNSMRTSALEMGKKTVTATSLSARLTALKVSALSTGTAFATMGRFIAGAFPPVLVITAISFAMEKFFAASMKAKAEAEELNSKMKELTNSFTENQSTINSLVGEYEKLERIRNSNGLNIQQEERYKEIQNEIAEIMPTVVQGIGDKNNSILISSERLKEEIALLERKLELEKQEATGEAITNISSAEKDIDDLEADIRRYEMYQDRFRAIMEDEGNSEKKREKYREKVYEQEAKIVSAKQDIANLQLQINGYYKNLLSDAENLSEQDIEFLKGMDNTTIKAVEEMEALAQEIEHVRKVSGDMFSADEINSFEDEISGLFYSMSHAHKNGYEDWEQWRGALVAAGLDADKIISFMIKKTNDQAEAQNKMQKAIDVGLYEDMEGKIPIATVDRLNQLNDDGAVIYNELGQAVDEYGDVLDEATQSTKDLADISQILFGINKDEVALAEHHARVYEILSQQTSLNTEQSKALGQAYDFLSGKYPHLIQNGQLRINSIYSEIGADKALLKATAGLASGMMTNEEAITAKKLIETQNRIDILNAEITAINAVMPKINMAIYGEAGGIHGATTATAKALQDRINMARLALPDLRKTRQALATELDAMTNPSSGSSGSGSKGSSSKSNEYITDRYAQAIDKLELKIKKLQATQAKQPTTSSKYRKALEDEIKLQQQKIKLTNSEINRLERLAKSSKRSGGSRNNKEYDQLIKEINKLNSVKIDVSSTITSLRENISQSIFDDTLNRIEKEYAAFEKKIKAINRKISIAETDDLNTQVKLNQQKLALIIQQQKQAQANVTQLKNTQKTIKNNRDALQKNTAEIEKWSEIIADFNVEIVELTRSIINMRTQIADQLIDAMKRYYQEKEKLELESNRKEMDMLKKSHDEKMKMLDEEMKAHQDLYDEKIREIDQQESQDSFDKELSEKQKEREELKRQIALRSLDDSASARLEVAKLQEELSKTEEQIRELMHKRQIELIKENLRDELDAKQQQIDAEKENAEFVIEINGQMHRGTYEQLLERLENERVAIERHYENIIENERYWAEVREDILAGNVDKYVDMLSEFADEINSNMAFLGESISQNLMDSLFDVRKVLLSVTGDIKKELTDIEKQMAKTTNPSTSSNMSSGSGGSSGGSSSGSSSGSSGGSSSGSSVGDLPLRKHPTGYATPSGGWDLENSVVDRLKSKGYYAEMSDREALFKYFKGSGTYSGTGSQNSWLLEKLKIVGLETGGYTGKNEGLAYLHKAEQVLNKDDTKYLFEAVKFSDSLMNSINSLVKKMDFSNFIQQPKVNSTSPVYNLTLNIDSFSGSKADANNVSRTILDNLKKLGR